MKSTAGLVTLLLVSLRLVYAADTTPSGPISAGKPNVLFIVSDDLRTWLGGYGDPQARTPNLDRLAARGTVFTDAYCGAPLCNPSRTSLLTGMRPSVTGVYKNDVVWFEALPGVLTLPQWFKQQGYYVSGAGKVTHAKHVRRTDWHDFGPVGERTIGPGTTRVDALDWTVMPDHKETEIDDYVLTSYVVDRLKQKHDQPFFLACGLHQPHPTWDVPQKYFDLYPLNAVKQPPIKRDDLADVPPIGRAMALKGEGDDSVIRAIPQGPEMSIQAYRAAISFMDAQVGRLLDALDASGQRDNTIIVFWGDNGWNHGEKQHWAKAVLWQEATKVPLIWVAPGITRPGTVCKRPVDFLTIFPTLCDLAGLPAPAQCQDPSIRPLLANPRATWDRPAVSTMGMGNHAVCDERWRYIRYLDGTEELYDHSVDPNEWVNLAGDPTSAVVRARLARWLPTQEAAPKTPPASAGKQKAGKAKK